MYVTSMYGALLVKADVSDEHSGGQQVFEALLVAAHSCLILVVVAKTDVLAWVMFRDGRIVLSQKVTPVGESFRGDIATGIATLA